MRHVILWAVGSMALLGLAGLSLESQAGQKPHHPHMHYALFELREARKELNETKHNYGGHKEKALTAINDAIKNIDIALKNAGDNIKGKATKKDLAELYKGYAHHPHLHHAVHELKHAHVELKEAKHDFGGHRAIAARDVNAAIEQIELILKHAKKP